MATELSRELRLIEKSQPAVAFGWSWSLKIVEMGKNERANMFSRSSWVILRTAGAISAFFVCRRIAYEAGGASPEIDDSQVDILDHLAKLAWWFPPIDWSRTDEQIVDPLHVCAHHARSVNSKWRMLRHQNQAQGMIEISIRQRHRCDWRMTERIPRRQRNTFDLLRRSGEALIKSHSESCSSIFAFSAPMAAARKMRFEFARFAACILKYPGG